MIGEWSEALEATRLATALRTSTLAYPLVNASHVLGIGLLVGAVFALDLRLLGLWRRAALEPLWRVLVPLASAGLILAVVSGTLLFLTRASEYIDSFLFLTKMGLLLLALLNAWGMRRFRHRPMLRADGGPIWPVAGVAALSLVSWLGVLLCGRLVGYF